MVIWNYFKHIQAFSYPWAERYGISLEEIEVTSLDLLFQIQWIPDS